VVHPYDGLAWKSAMSITQNEKAARFRALHDGPGAFVIPNPWDVGSARILAALASRHWPHPALPPPLPLAEGRRADAR